MRRKPTIDKEYDQTIVQLIVKSVGHKRWYKFSDIYHAIDRMIDLMTDDAGEGA